MNYVLTGAYGFLGKYILEVLKEENVYTVGRGAENDEVCDLSIAIPKLPKSDVIIHCAGKAHSVPRTAAEKKEFFEVNLSGTRNLISGIEKTESMPTLLIFISTVAVYGVESGKLISESHPLAGESPYAKSKIDAERLLQEWGLASGVAIVILRLPLLVGINPPGNLGKMIAGIKSGKYASIAGGKARKSMVLAADVAKLIPTLTKKSGTYNLTDGYHPTFGELEGAISDLYKVKIRIKLSLASSKLLGKIGDYLPFFPINSSVVDKICNDLTFDDSKARKELSWNPQPVLNSII